VLTGSSDRRMGMDGLGTGLLLLNGGLAVVFAILETVPEASRKAYFAPQFAREAKFQTPPWMKSTHHLGCLASNRNRPAAGARG